MLSPPTVDVKKNLNKCGSRWDKQSFCNNEWNQGIRKTIVFCQNNCLSLEVSTPDNDTWHVHMTVSVCQSDSMGQEEENKEEKEVGKEEEDGFIRALS